MTLFRTHNFVCAFIMCVVPIGCTAYSQQKNPKSLPVDEAEISLQQWDKDIEWPLSEIAQAIAILAKKNQVPSFENVNATLKSNFEKNETYDFGSWVTYEAYNCKTNSDGIPLIQLEQICQGNDFLKSYLFRIYKRKYWLEDGFSADKLEGEGASKRIAIIRSSLTNNDFNQLLETAFVPQKFKITKLYYSHLVPDHVSLAYADSGKDWIVAGNEHDFALQRKPDGVLTERYLATIKIYIGKMNEK